MPTSSVLRLSHLDLTLVALYLAAITIFGLRFARKGKQSSSLKGYFLADNTIPWWAIALSIVSAETSTLTIISIPGVAFGGDMGFLQIVLGYMLGRIVVAFLFLPKYFRGEMLTAYQLIDRRFGPVLHKVTAGLFLLTRAAAEGVRVFAISIVVSIAIGTGDTLSIAIISALTLLYTFEGGMAAVIWTDVIQMGLYIIGTLAALWAIGHGTPGGWAHIHAVAAPLGKFHVLNFAFNLTHSYTFWAGILGGTFLTMASHGTDQLMVQRMLAARNLRESRLALLSSGVVIFFQFTLFLLIGIGLYVFYNQPTPSGAPSIAHSAMGGMNTLSPDRIFPTFIVQQMPHGVAGLLVAAILAAAMSNLSAALNSLASTTVIDFYIPLRAFLSHRKQTSSAPFIAPLPHAMSGISDSTRAATPNEDRTRNLVSRISTIVWAVVLFAIAVYAIQHGGKGHVVETGLSIASVAYGSLLGVFLLGTLTRYATQWGAILGMLCGFALNLYLWKETPIAFTWYVLIGSVATFALGSLFSLLLPRPRRPAITATSIALLLCLLAPFGLSFRSEAKEPAFFQPPQSSAPTQPQSYDFTPISTLITEAISKHQLPGAVVVIGHQGHVVFEKAYGNRALEPTIEPMTEDTIFDMASLTKVLVTTTAILQLYEQHKLDLDAPVAKYLPEFASTTGSPTPLSFRSEAEEPASRPSPDPALKQAATWKSQITIRQLLTHYSGLPPDISLEDDWGLKAPDKAEGIRRAMASVPYGPPGQTFKYSDINFITLGLLVEKLSGTDLWKYAGNEIFHPLSMADTSYRPFTKVCTGPFQTTHTKYGDLPSPKQVDEDLACGFWAHLDRIAPTAHDDQGIAATNPNFDHLLRGTVHDPTTRRMGGVAGHAGVFSTAEDTARFCAALLAKLLHNTGPFPLSQATLRLATTPNEPTTALANATIFTPDGKATRPDGSPNLGVASRGLGWDLNTAYSRPRGEIFPISTAGRPGSFGHTGFTGTSIWIDPTSDIYIILLANSVHIPHAAALSTLRGQVATATAKALGLPALSFRSAAEEEPASPSTEPTHVDAEMAESGVTRPSYPATTGNNSVILSAARSAQSKDPESLRPSSVVQTFSTTGSNVPSGTSGTTQPQPQTQTGIDILESTRFAALKNLAATHNNHLRLGIVANQSSIDAHDNRTIDILSAASKADPTLELTTIFTPEHGLFARQDTEHLAQEQDPATHLPVLSLYGPKPSDKHARQSDLKKLDAVLIDLPDAGTRFWTYETLLGYFLEDCARAKVQVIVLDRPNPIGGGPAQGPLSDPGSESYINFMPLPVRHGMTMGELAQYFNANARLSHTAPDASDPEALQMGGGAGASATGSNIVPPAVRPGLHAALTIVKMQGWHRDEYFADTGVPWVPPSPNMKTPATDIVYPAVALIETTNMSVGRGSPAPYENFGAAFVNAPELAAYLTARNISGVAFTATTLTIAEAPEKYPFHGQTIPGIHITVTDRNALDTPALGVEILSALHHLYTTEFHLDKAGTILRNAVVLAALKSGKDPKDIVAAWAAALQAFNDQRQPYLLYR